MRTKPKAPRKKRYYDLNVEELLSLLPPSVFNLVVCQYDTASIIRPVIRCGAVLIRTPNEKGNIGHWCCPMLHGKLIGDAIFFDRVARALRDENRKISEGSQKFDFKKVKRIIQRVQKLRYNP